MGVYEENIVLVNCLVRDVNVGAASFLSRPENNRNRPETLRDRHQRPISFLSRRRNEKS